MCCLSIFYFGLGARCMKRLFIIGNGFDLWHGLPTSYVDFYQCNQEYLDELDMYFTGIEASTTPWSDFENNLGSYDWEAFFDYFNEIDFTDDSFKQSMLYGLEDDLRQQAEDLVDGLAERFREWIVSIDVEGCERRIILFGSDRFFSFNYTSTLQRVYGIKEDKIFHVHGNANAYDELVFGHGVEIVEQPELDDEGNSLRTPISDSEGAAMSPLNAFKKPVPAIIEDNIEYFTSLSDVTEIVVIGHSLNDIDLPYFKIINDCAPNAEWKVTYFKSDEVMWFEKQMIKVGVYSDRLTMIRFSGMSKL